MLMYADVCLRMRTHADVNGRMLTYADVCGRMLLRMQYGDDLNTFACYETLEVMTIRHEDEREREADMRIGNETCADVFSRMLTYAHVCSRMPCKTP